MQPIIASVRLMTCEEQQEYRLYSKGLMLEYHRNDYRLNAGVRDHVNVFIESPCLFILTINPSLDYLGLDAYMLEEADPVNTVFLHSVSEIEEALGKRWRQMKPETIVSRLKGYLM